MFFLTEHTLDAHLPIIDLAILEQGMVQGLPCAKEKSSVLWAGKAQCPLYQVLE